MGVRARLLRDLVSSLRYIKNISEQQIRASLWRGEGTLYDIEFDPARLQELLVDICPVGLEILEVRVDELYVKIPWRNLGTQAMLVVPKNIVVRFRLRCADEADWRQVIGPMLRRERQGQRQMLLAAAGTLGDAAGTINQLKQRILNGMKLRVDHVRVDMESLHPRHHSAHRAIPEDPEASESVKALAVELRDVLLTPCDVDHSPSDLFRSMAMFAPRERTLQLTRLMTVRSFRVLAPPGPPPCVLGHLDFFDSPCTFTCLLTDRATSDGPRFCPILLSSELHFDVKAPLRVRCCECQMASFFAIVNDIAQLEDWRLSEAIMGETNADELMNTSELARTFAQGPSPPPQRTVPFGQRPSLLCLGGMPGIVIPSAGNVGGLVQATSALGFSSKIWGNMAAAAVATATGISQRTGTGTSPALTSPSGGAAPNMLAEIPSVAHPSAEGLAECPDPLEAADEEDEDDDVYCGSEDLDYYSVASDNTPSLRGLGGTAKGKDWLGAVRSWFKNDSSEAQSAATTGESDTIASTDFGSRFSAISVSFNSLTLHVATATPSASCDRHGTDTLMGGGCNGTPSGMVAEILKCSFDRLHAKVETTLELTELERECVHRFAWPSDAYSCEAFWPWQLRRLVRSEMSITSQRFRVGVGDLEVFRYVGADTASEIEHNLMADGVNDDAEPMLRILLRPRGAPPVRLLPKWMNCNPGTELEAWPGQLFFAHTLLIAEPTALQVICRCFERVKPSLVSKLPPPLLIAAHMSHESFASDKLFPAECFRIRCHSCEVLENDEARVISRERRWPWRAYIPDVIFRSDTSLWEMANAWGCDPPVAGRPSAPGPRAMKYPTLSPALQPSGGGGCERASAEVQESLHDKDGMVSIPKEMFDELVRRAAENTKKDSQVSAAREELQRAYIALATKRPTVASFSVAAPIVRKKNVGVGSCPGHSSDEEQRELDRLRQKCLQLEASLQSQALTQRRLETELAHHQALAQEELRRFAAAGRRL